MTRDHGADHTRAGATRGWKASLAAVLKVHNGARHDGAVASFATQDKRADVPTRASRACTRSASA